MLLIVLVLHIHMPKGLELACSYYNSETDANEGITLFFFFFYAFFMKFWCLKI